MTFFEYQVIIGKITTTNSYQSLRKLHKVLEAQFESHFYSIHAINKVIKKFKEQTSSNIIKQKNFTIGTSYESFNNAIQSAETKEQILLLLADFQGEKEIHLPSNTQSILHMVNLGVGYSDLYPIQIEPDYYSIGQDDSAGLMKVNRLPLCIMCYLEPIKDTEIYTSLLSKSLTKFKHWNSTPAGLTSIFNKIQNQIDKQEANIKALKQAQILFKKITDDTSGNIPTT